MPLLGLPVPHKCVKSSLELLGDFIRAPLESNICLLRVQNALDCIEFEMQYYELNFAELVKFASKQSSLLRDGIRFLTGADTLEKYRLMISCFSHCRCDRDFTKMETFVLHRICDSLSTFLNEDLPESQKLYYRYTELPDPKMVFSKLGELIGGLMALSLSRTPPNVFHKKKVKPDGKTIHQKWPQDPDDFLPFGIEHTIRALTIWATESPISTKSFVWRLAIPLAITHDPLCCELFQFVGDKFKYDLAFQLPVKQLDDLLIEYREDLKRVERIATPREGIQRFLTTMPTPRLTDFANSLHHPWWFMTHATDLIGISQRWILMTEHAKTFRPVLDRLSAVLSRSNEVVTTSVPDIKQSLDTMKRCGPLGIPYNPFTGEVEFLNREGLYNTLGDGQTSLIEANAHGCHFPGCPKPELETKNAKVCAKCGLVRFCSPDCQRLAWKSSSLPHKVLCAKIVMLKESFGPKVWKQIFRHEFEATKDFRNICLSQNVSEELVIEIGAELKDLKTEKRRLQGGTATLTS